MKILRICFPTIIGYLSVGSVFGFIFSSLGATPLQSLIVGLFVYAGAAQFLLVESIKSDITLLPLSIGVLALNLRHIFYGVVFNMFSGISTLGKVYLSLTLTDETYAIMSSRKHSNLSNKEIFSIFFINHLTWAFSCFLGSMFFSSISVSSISDFSFILTAMFLVLLLDHSSKIRNNITHVKVVLVLFVLIFLLPPKLFLFTAVLASLIVVYLEGKKNVRE